MKKCILVALLLGSAAVPLSARIRRPAFSQPVQPAVVQDTGRWEIWEDNLGRFTTPLPGSKSGGYWPKQSGNNYIFGAGLWVGALDPTVSDTVVVIGYNPSSGQAQWAPCLPNGDTTGADTSSLVRVYRSDIPLDTAQWPERDSLGRAIIYSDQELWAISAGYSFFAPRPLGVVSIRRSLAWDSPGPWGDIVEMEFVVKNVTGRFQENPHTLKKMILGLCMDDDIGNEAGTNANDLCSFDYPRNLAIQYQVAQEPGWGPPPYYEGLKFVQTPKATDTVQVRDSQHGHVILPGQPLGMTAYKVADLQTSIQSPYLWLAGMYSLSDTNDAYSTGSLGPGRQTLPGFVRAIRPA